MASPSLRRCAIYARKSSEDGLEQDFNSLHAQREACEAFTKSQAGEGWCLIKTAYDDGGLSGGSMERPALQRLLTDIRQGLVDVVVVYKVDRLTRSWPTSPRWSRCSMRTVSRSSRSPSSSTPRLPWDGSP
jgi:site-specific DNA recombinase